MQILFLGTSGSSITASRTNSSILIDNDLLIDVGEGTTQKLLQFEKLTTIRNILVSHLHVDHFIGIFTLIWKKWLMNDLNPITIWGPPSTEDAIKTIFELTSTPVEVFPFSIDYRMLDPQDAIKTYGEISTTRVQHPVYTLAYRINRKKSICYSSDTAPLKRMVRLAKGCDLLIHDCSMPNKMANLAHKWTHSTPKDAAEIATQAGVKKLVLFHILGEIENQMDQVLQDAQDYFTGEIILARDLTQLEV